MCRTVPSIFFVVIILTTIWNENLAFSTAVIPHGQTRRRHGLSSVAMSMALMIPESIPHDERNVPAGERFLFYKLRENLDDSYMVWWNVQNVGNGSDRTADFVVLSPTLGLWVVEAKGWRHNQILEGDCHRVLIEYKTSALGNGRRTQVQKHPLKQADTYKDALLNALLEESILRHPAKNSYYQGHLLFPVGRCVVMTGMDRNTALNKPNKHHVLTNDIFHHRAILFRDDVDAWEDYTKEEMDRQWKGLFASHLQWDMAPLSADQIQTIKAVINPSTRLYRQPAVKASWNLWKEASIPPHATIVRALDLQQERMARQLRPGHRVLAGVAGSGKTLILLARAKYLAEQNPLARILITCFNRVLAANLRSLLRSANSEVPGRGLVSYDNIEIQHFHGWAGKRVGKGPTYTRNPSQDEKLDAKLAQKVMFRLAQRPNDRYDAILVDEAHIMHGQWFACLVQALKDPEHGDLLIVCDREQKLRHRHAFTWKSVGVKAQGRTTILTRSYRNTQEISNTAWRLQRAFATVGGFADSLRDDDEAAFPVVKPSQASQRHGPRPRLIKVTSGGEVLPCLVECIHDALKAGVKATDIAILYRFNQKDTITVLKKYLEGEFGSGQGNAVYWISHGAASKDGYGVDKPAIRLSTVQSALGLEFKHVYMVYPEHFQRELFYHGERHQPERTAALKELYVALTRAQEALSIITVRGTPMSNCLNDQAAWLGFDVFAYRR